MADTVYEEQLKELKLIKTILKVGHEEKLILAVESLATTDLKKKMWVLATGDYSYKEIAKFLKTSDRSVQYFISEGSGKGLIELVKRGYPKRTLDVMPNWGQVFKLEDIVGKNSEPAHETLTVEGGNTDE